MEGQNCSNYMEIKLQGDKTTRKLHGIKTTKTTTWR